MKNKFIRIFMALSTVIILIVPTLIPTTNTTDDYCISICGIEDDEEPFDQEPTPNNP